MYHIRVPSQTQARDHFANHRWLVYVYRPIALLLVSYSSNRNDRYILRSNTICRVKFDLLIVLCIAVVPAVIVGVCLAINRTVGYGGPKT